MVIAPWTPPGSKGPGSSPGRVIVLYCVPGRARHFTLTVPISTHGNLTECWRGGRGGRAAAAA